METYLETSSAGRYQPMRGSVKFWVLYLQVINDSNPVVINLHTVESIVEKLKFSNN